MVFSSWSSLFCNTSARDKRHKCDTSEKRATQVRHERREWVCWERDKSAKQTTRVQHECYTNDTSVTRVKYSDFYNDTSENIIFHPILAAWQVKDYKERIHSKNYLSEMSRFHAKICLNSGPQKLNFVMAKVMSKRYTLDCSCKCPYTFQHIYA